jgi:putative ABC transport system permease protein
VANVASLVAAQAVRLAAVGVPIGVVLALAAGRAFTWRLMMIDVFDIGAYAGGVVIVAAACIAASCVPALRASRLDPMATLRAD